MWLQPFAESFRFFPCEWCLCKFINTLLNKVQHLSFLTEHQVLICTHFTCHHICHLHSMSAQKKNTFHATSLFGLWASADSINTKASRSSADNKSVTELRNCHWRCFFGGGGGGATVTASIWISINQGTWSEIPGSSSSAASSLSFTFFRTSFQERYSWFN